MLIDEHQAEKLIDHAALLMRDCSWALFRRVEVNKQGDPEDKIPITLYYDPSTRKRIKESDLPDGWQCSYEAALSALGASRSYYDGIAFLLTKEDPYHVTIVKGGGWALEDKDYTSWEWGLYHAEMHRLVEEILEEQSTYAFHAPFGSDIYLIGKAKRPENRYKKCGWMLKFESYDGGWDKTQKKFTPKFVPFSEKPVNGYDVAIADLQSWVETYVPEKGCASEEDDEDDILYEDLTSSTMDESFGPPKKVARVRPVGIPPENTMPVVATMRCAKWAYENPQPVEDEDGEDLWGLEQQWKFDRYARSPKTGEKIFWGEENFEKTKHLWGTYEEAYLAYEADEESQGVILLIEPYRTFTIDDRDSYVVFFDFDDCRDPDTEEIRPRVKQWIEEMNTYFEISPSGKGVRGIGFAEKRPGSRSRFELCGHEVEVYGGNQGGRHLITFTGVPITDKPISVVQDWIDKHVPINEVGPDNEAVKPEPLEVSDEEVVQIILRSKDAPLFRRFMEGDQSLWQGRESKYKSRSEADQGFLRLLAFYTRKDYERIERIALSSKMRRKRWDYRGYLHTTIERAINYCKDIYDPNMSSSSEERQKRKEELIRRCAQVCLNLKNHRMRKNLEACLAVANTYGWYSWAGYRWVIGDKEYYIPEEGILFYHSIRNHGLYTAQNEISNISKQMKELREASLVTRIDRGKGFSNSFYLMPKRAIEDMDYEDEASENTNPFLSVFDYYVVNRETPSLHQQLAWIQKPREGKPGLKDNQKLLIERVLLGGTANIDRLIEFFGMRPKNFKSRVLKPLIEMELLEYDGDNGVRLPDDFEEILHRLYVVSEGEEAHKRTEERFREEQGEYRKSLRKSEGVDEDSLDAPSEIVVDEEFFRDEDPDSIRKKIAWLGWSRNSDITEDSSGAVSTLSTNDGAVDINQDPILAYIGPLLLDYGFVCTGTASGLCKAGMGSGDTEKLDSMGYPRTPEEVNEHLRKVAPTWQAKGIDIEYWDNPEAEEGIWAFIPHKLSSEAEERVLEEIWSQLEWMYVEYDESDNPFKNHP